jgi:hypothetical protein
MALDLVTPFFRNNPLAEDGVFTAPLADPKTIKLFFDRSESIFAAGVKLQNADTKAEVITSDVGDQVPSGSTLTARGIVYKIKNYFSDGNGTTILSLSKD